MVGGVAVHGSVYSPVRGSLSALSACAYGLFPVFHIHGLGGFTDDVGGVAPIPPIGTNYAYNSFATVITNFVTAGASL